MATVSVPAQHVAASTTVAHAREPWQAGQHRPLALDILEDVAGNQIGRAFEVDNFDTVDKSPDSQRIMIPFDVRAAASN